MVSNGPTTAELKGYIQPGHEASPPDRIVLDIRDTTNVLFFRDDLRLIEDCASTLLSALQSKRKATLDELDGFFKRNLWSGRDQGMKVFRHQDECVQKESSLAAIFEDGSLKELRVGRDLKNAAALRRYRGHEVGTRFLRCQSHVREH